MSLRPPHAGAGYPTARRLVQAQDFPPVRCRSASVIQHELILGVETPRTESMSVPDVASRPSSRDLTPQAGLPEDKSSQASTLKGGIIMEGRPHRSTDHTGDELLPGANTKDCDWHHRIAKLPVDREGMKVGIIVPWLPWTIDEMRFIAIGMPQLVGEEW